jgi:hypothetical protein
MDGLTDSMALNDTTLRCTTGVFERVTVYKKASAPERAGAYLRFKPEGEGAVLRIVEGLAYNGPLTTGYRANVGYPLHSSVVLAYAIAGVA